MLGGSEEGHLDFVPSRLLLVDDHNLVRQSFRLMLSGEPYLQVVGEAGDGMEAVSMAESTGPDIILMDVGMPRLDGVEATREIVSRNPEIRVLILTMDPDPSVSNRAKQAGAVGFVRKDASVEELLSAVREALGIEYTPQKQMPDKVRKAYDSLTDREMEVLQMLALGHTNARISGELYLSLSTVKAYVRRITTKLGVENRVQAAIIATVLGNPGEHRRFPGES